MPTIVAYDGMYQLPKNVMDLDAGKRFDFIFDHGVWARSAGNESMSGSGSTIRNTELYRSQLNNYLDLHSDSQLTFFDAPCGDLNWILRDLQPHIQYVGGDISGSLVSKLKKDYPSLNIFKFDITEDEFPVADIWHCRHCLFHLSISDIHKALKNFVISDIEKAHITNHFLPDVVTLDIPTGSFRFLDLTNFPFYFPEPEVWLLDEHPASGKTAMATGVWTKDQVGEVVTRFESLMVQ